MELKDIQNLIKFVAKSGASEVKLEMEDVKITIKTGSDEKETIVQHMQMPAQMPQQMAAAPAPAPAQPVAQAAAAAPADSNNGDDSKYITVKSPIIGTFYRKPSPDKDLFCEVGDSIKEGDVLCIIEAMKLFNEIESEVSGKIVKVLVDDSSPVEFDQPLFLVDPS
ncbi:acetyl-CoA carboxylase biotin carboxyl carrier protein [Croceibacter atlanticus]|jgi:acetyl-CoA carboxylase biotin carboxyl carrier protein|uniref:Biotin carboxyl carrier protein of acetyl-CoA carboxylase n=1 Tax=Croceibacter atlanticus (strain ATCC BAA-628 / JCM 21780 / CIP 108009 / IAM 15332 / KCTC 12090 / HTCC2559) TaxID=216432 RepID=A3U5P2_CROAH|nr:acetyl-CoA carboxylase biotin carboxyl carrier protein [Croceibacter atlanticus]EAP87559.1 biotin carboxyl carrier protein of acetyl-CoA carboxylase [Croceibacter atlanticus HTCC2559]MAM23020.1 acetyl-CoA carboxylase, biotin carboxyl carrier protein [Croceibacter sp.]WSP35235.1 acetyl-CoA carboxylase biotin carboxyl carrier protein [Croceibacter atlanticus]|tara:strand:- start:1458 stop:1955 length:498 start_codon:yes stop_codon:yes gene_type:complete